MVTGGVTPTGELTYSSYVHYNVVRDLARKGSQMRTYAVPFYKRVSTTVLIEASSFEEAYKKACQACGPSVKDAHIKDEEDWEVDHENIEEQG